MEISWVLHVVLGQSIHMPRFWVRECSLFGCRYIISDFMLSCRSLFCLVFGYDMGVSQEEKSPQWDPVSRYIPHLSIEWAQQNRTYKHIGNGGCSEPGHICNFENVRNDQCMIRIQRARCTKPFALIFRGTYFRGAFCPGKKRCMYETGALGWNRRFAWSTQVIPDALLSVMHTHWRVDRTNKGRIYYKWGWLCIPLNLLKFRQLTRVELCIFPPR